MIFLLVRRLACRSVCPPALAFQHGSCRGRASPMPSLTPAEVWDRAAVGSGDPKSVASVTKASLSHMKARRCLAGGNADDARPTEGARSSLPAALRANGE